MSATALTHHGRVERTLLAARRGFSSRWFIWVVVGLAFASCMTIALSADYFLLYDEFYHFGIIQLMVEQGTPFLTDTESVRGLGDVERFGSYFYHFVMSGPAALASALGANEYAQVLLLRSLTIIMSVASLPIFARALRIVGVGAATSNVAMLVFSAIPVFSFVAATINYDGMVLLISAVFSLLLARAATESPARVTTALLLIGVGSIGSITKYTFLPVFIAGVLGLVVLLAVRARRRTTPLFESPLTGKLRLASFVAAGIFALVAVALFCERYLVNLLTYGSPSPDCATVHDAEYCASYGPWGRNETLDAGYPDRPFGVGPMLTYFTRMWSGAITSTIDVVGVATKHGVVTADDVSTYTWFAAVGLTIAVFLIILMLPRVFRSSAASILAATAVLYLGALFWTNYSDFRTMGIPLGIQSRYVLPLVPLLLGAAGLGLSRVLSGVQARPLAWKVAAVAVLLFASLQGGWALSYLLSTGLGWYHPDSPLTAVLPLLDRLAGVLVLTD